MNSLLPAPSDWKGGNFATAAGVRGHSFQELPCVKQYVFLADATPAQIFR